jgi:ribosomal protein S18 acetylase RimI-like enzyme
LIELAESEARRRGLRELTLYTHECMTENIGMYRALGYVETERRTESGYRRVYMRKVVGVGQPAG